MDEQRRESHWGWGQCRCCTGRGYYSLTSSGLPYWQGGEPGWEGCRVKALSPQRVWACSSKRRAGSCSEQADRTSGWQVSNCPPTLSSTGTNITSIRSCCKGCLQGKREQLERQLQHTQHLFSSSFQEWLLKVPTPSPQFSSQDGHAEFSKDISLWEPLLTLGTNLTATTSSGLLPPAPDVLCPPSPPSFCFSCVGLWLDGAAVCQSFPLRPVWQQSRQASQPQSLPPQTPYFQGRLWHLARRVSPTLPPAGLPFSVKLDTASTPCPTPPVMLSTVPECTNTTRALSHICFVRSALFKSDTLIHAFTFLGDVNTSSYIQNEKGSSNSIEIGL